MLKKTYSLLLILIIGIAVLFLSCKKSKNNPSPTAPIIDKSIFLNSSSPSAKDTLYVTRNKYVVLLKVSASIPSGNELKRLYVFRRILDGSNIGQYETWSIPNAIKDGNNQYYYAIPPDQKENTSTEVILALRLDASAIMDEFYFVYTDNADYAGPSSNTGVIIGPAQFYIVYGKLTLYQNNRLYNAFTTSASSFPGLDVINMVTKTIADAPADMDIYENTDDNALFLGKFKSRNNTTFVKAAQSFPFANATDKMVEAEYISGEANAFTETPDSVKIGDIYLMQLRGDKTKYAAMKILYLVPEDGHTDSGHNNEYILFNVRK